MDWLKRLKKETGNTPDPLRVAEEYDRQKWAAEIERTIHEICSRYPGSLRDWLEKERPPLYAKMKQAERDIDGGFEDQDAGRLRKGLDEYQAILAEGFQLYKAGRDREPSPPGNTGSSTLLFNAGIYGDKETNQ